MGAHTQHIRQQAGHNRGINTGNMLVRNCGNPHDGAKTETEARKTRLAQTAERPQNGESEMAKLGEFEYPEIGLLESIELGKKVSREFAGEVSRHGLARSLGMAERGGAFAARIGALRMWGIATGRSRIRVTRDGLRAVNPLSPQESDSARRTLASHVNLFSEMGARMSAGPYDHARLAVLVEEITGAERPVVAGKIVALDRVFSEVRSLLVKRTSYTPDSSSKMDTVQSFESIDEFPEEPSIHALRHGSEKVMAPGLVGSAVADRVPERGGSHKQAVPDDLEDMPRIEIILPDGRLSLPESVSNVDAALTVLWARRQLLAAIDASKGKPSPPPPKDFPAR